jgi:iron complex outermembrane recepter protein
MNRITKFKYAAAPLALSLVLLSTSAFAQDAESKAEEASDAIVVTGSRIARPDLQGASPVAVISGDTIARSGANSVEEVLRFTPQAVQAIGGNSNNGNPGVATIDLRNQGESRTLVTVDGKRFVPYDSDGAVDLNMIPTALISRVDILTGGASAVYGSDAVAGVVNFVTKRDFSGVEIDTQYGLTSRGDGRSWANNATFGHNFGDRGNVVLNLGYTDVSTLLQGSRKFSASAFSLDDFTNPSGSFTDVDGKLNGSFPTLCSPEEVDEGSCFAQFDAAGNLGPVTGTYNFNPVNLLQVPQKKLSGTMLLRYEVTDNVELFGRASVAQTKVNTVLAPTGTFFFPFTVNGNNPLLSAQAKSLLTLNDEGNYDISIGRRLPELGTRTTKYKNLVLQFVGGVRGNVTDSIKYEAFAQYGRTRRTIKNTNDFDYAKLQQAILTSNGTTCITATGGCVVANIFGPGKLSQAAADYIRLDVSQVNTTTQLVSGASLAGDIPITSPFASNPAAFAIGIEYRKERAVNKPDDNLIAGNAPGYGSSLPINASFDTKEAFVEFKAPLIEDKPFFQQLAVEAGYRFAKYTNSFGRTFNNSTFKIGGDWQPVDDVRFRAMYQRAVRAPNISDIGVPRTPGTGNLSEDPCAGNFATKPAALRALCIATGVPADAAIVSGPIVGQIGNFSGGNPALTPEKASTFTVGAVIQPRFAKKLSLTVDYFNIGITDAIQAISEQNIINSCYGIDQARNPIFCDRIIRSPLNGSLNGGSTVGVDVRLVNAAFSRTSGVDIGAAYSFNLGSVGELGFAMQATRVIKDLSQDAPGLPIIECKGKVGPVCDRPNPKWRFVQTTSLQTGPLSLQLDWRYLSAITRDTFDAAALVPVIKRRSYFDLSGQVDVNGSFSIRFGVDNLFDKQPPLVGSNYGTTIENSANTYPATYDTLGRRYFVGAKISF